MQDLTTPSTRNALKLFTCILIGVSLVGCATTQKVDAPPFSNKAIEKIEQNTRIAAKAQERLAQIQAENRKIANMRYEQMAEDHLDIDYIGLPEPLLQALANRYGLKYKVLGKERDLRTVNIRSENVSPIELLRNIGNQIDYGSDVVLDNDKKTLELIYKPEVHYAN